MDDYFTKIDLNTEEGKASYINEIARIKSSTQPLDTKLNLLNLLMHDFLRKRFHIRKNEEYSEMIEYFLAKNKPHIAIFCNEMIKQLYSGESMNQSTIMILLDDARIMIEKELYGSSSISRKKKPKTSIFSPIFNKFKKKEKPQEESSPKTVSKQTEKIIENTLSPEQSIRIEDHSNDEDEQKETKLNTKSIESLRSQLHLTISPKDAPPIIEGENHKSIESIDNLERIKQKIRFKQAIYAQQQLQKRTQEQMP